MNTHVAGFPFVCLALAVVVSFGSALTAQTPPPPAKRLPPAGIVIPDAARAELTAGADELRRELDRLAAELSRDNQTALAALLPDAEIFHKAVDWALRYDEFFDIKQLDVARHLLAVGRERVAQLRRGQAPWTTEAGLVVRGYRSKLDGSVQPYALVLPEGWNDRQPRRLDVVLPGRGEKRTELAFLDDHEKKPGEIVPPNAIVLHPYGRYCNATKFAGEVDVFEALAAVQHSYPVDASRIVLRGFSMGGASTWHLATHHPDRWVAAAPGAGFAETAAYTKALAPGKPVRPEWERTLWRWYDATGYAANLLNLPTIAYSGELDPQKQAADIMTRAMCAEGLELEHLIGPQTAHKYHPETKARLIARLDAIVARGRKPHPAEEHFTTYTLRYSSSGRIRIRELEHPWERTDVHLRVAAPDRVEVTTRNVSVFTLVLDPAAQPHVSIDDQSVALGDVRRPFWFVKENDRWVFRDATFAQKRWGQTPRKVPGLSGPIDDAFMDPFLFVRPTGRPLNDATAAWSAAELRHATKMWRDLFRGDAPIKDDTAVTEEDIATRHLILWGDASSNRLLARVLATGKLPLEWNAQTLVFRGQSYDAAHHAPVLVFPNPLTSERRYVVLNSGIDFRDEAYGTNALQTPKLPDFAIIDLREPPGPRWPGKIVDAGFFDAGWK